jgi:monoterpene epsilon-lactone hydrolase
MRVFFKRLMARMGRAPEERLALYQVRAAGILEAQYCGLPAEYRIINNVPGIMLGDPSAVGKTLVLYLHGGAFVFPASSGLQVALLGRLCRDLDAVGFLVDYRLVPMNSAPAALDDCEHAYRGLLELGHSARRIAVVGESAGGNLVLCLLQRIRKAGLPMPACAVPISPITDLARAHAPPSRARNANSEALVPQDFAYRMTKLYAGALDPMDPEISPLYADFAGFPPLFFLASEREILLDDSRLAVQKARDAGVDTKLDIWPVLPHAFILFESMFVEASQARKDVVEFIRGHQ